MATIKDKVLPVRIKTADLEILEKAAEKEDITLSEFLRSAALKEAKKILKKL